MYSMLLLYTVNIKYLYCNSGLRNYKNEESEILTKEIINLSKIFLSTRV
jgi:hypothetical protein